MKVLANETKRILAVLLSVAMIFAYVPNNVMAYADPSDNEATVGEDASEQSVEESIEDDRLDAYQDTNLYITGGADGKTFPADTAVVTLAGDTPTALNGIDDKFTWSTSDGLTAVDSGGTTRKAAQIDSTHDFVAYIVPSYGYTLALDPEDIQVLGAYTGTATGATSTKIPDNDWSVESVGATMTYLDDADGYEWEDALKVTISTGDWLKAYSAALAGTGTVNSYLSIFLPAGSNASPNFIDFRVTVEGEEEIEGYFLDGNYSGTTVATDLSDSVPVAKWGDGTTSQAANELYNVEVAILDADGEKVGDAFVRNPVAKNDATTVTAPMDSTTINAFFLGVESTDLNLYLSPAARKTAYSALKDGIGEMVVSFTKKTADAETYVVKSADETYVTIKDSASKTIKTTYEEGKEVKATKNQKYIFTVVPVGTRVVSAVNYTINGVTTAAIPYDATNEKFEGESSYASQTPNTWGIKAASVTGPFTISAATKVGVSFDLPYDGEAGTSASLVNVDVAADGDTTVVDIDAGTTTKTTVTSASYTAKVGSEYSFTVTPKNNYNITSVTARMIPAGTGTDAEVITLTKNNFGKYSISDVTGAVTIIVRAARDESDKINIKKAAKAAPADAATAIANYTIREKSTGDEVTDVTTGNGAQNATFNFIVTPGSSYAVKKVEYTDSTHTTPTALTAVAGSVKADGSSEYNLAVGTSNVTLYVTTHAAVDLTKVANTDAEMTYNTEVIADGGEVRASTDSDVSFTITGKNNATVLGVFYGPASKTASDYDKSANTLNGCTRLESASSTYTMAASALSADSSIYIITSREEAASNYTATIDAAVGTAAVAKNVSSITLRAGGDQFTSDTSDDKKKAVDAYAVLTSTFYDKSGNNITSDGTILYAPAITASDAKLVKTNANGYVASGGTTADNKLVTTKGDGKDPRTDTITSTLTVAGAAFPKYTEFKKTVDLTVNPLNTFYDKIELKNTIGKTSGADVEPDSGVIRVNETGIDDKATYTIYTYQKNAEGESVKSASALAAADINTDKSVNITDAKWTSTPVVKPTVVTKPFVFAAAADKASASITLPTKDAVGTEINVTAEITFVDGSTLKSEPVGTKVIDITYGYFAIPTITTNGADIFNGSSIALETKSTGIRTSSVKWDVYEMTAATDKAAVKALDTAGVKTFNGGLSKITEANLETLLQANPTIKKVTNAATDVEFKAMTETPEDKGYVTIANGATTTITAAKKGSVALGLNANVGGLAVAANDISVEVFNNMQTYPVTVDTYSADPGFNTGFENPTYEDNLALRDLGTVSEKVDASGKSLGFVLTDVAQGSVIVLPAKNAFKTATVDKKFELIGWKVTQTPKSGSAKTTYHEIGDKVVVNYTTTIQAIWASKYQKDVGSTGGAINLVTYNNNVAGALANNALTIANGKNTVIAAAYKPLDKTGMINTTDGSAIYQANFVYTTSGISLEKSTAHQSIAAVTATGNRIEAHANSVANPVTVNIKFTDADGAVYDAADASNKDDLRFSNFAVSCAAPKELELETEAITLKAGQTKSIASTLTVNGTVSTFNSASIESVSVNILNGTKAKAGEVDLTSGNTNNAIVFTGLEAGNTTVTITARDAEGNEAKAENVAITVTDTDFDIVPYVTNDSVTLEKQTGTILLKANASNTLVLEKETKTGTKIGTTDANWGYTAGTGTVATGEVAWGYNTSGTTKSSTINLSSTGTQTGLAKGILTVVFTDTTDSSTYVKEFPVLTYQTVTVKAPASAPADYKVTKDGVALETGKDAVEKIVYAPGTTQYEFSTAAYDFEWIKETGTQYDPYWWEASYTTSPNADNKLADIGGKVKDSVLTAAALNTTPVVLNTAFGSQKITLSNLPETITLSDEKLSTLNANGTDVAVIKVDVTPYDSSNKISINGSDTGMYKLAKGDVSYKTTGTIDDTNTLYGVSTLTTSAIELDIDAQASTKKSRTDVFTVAKHNDNTKDTFVGESTITVYANGDVYKTIPLYVNGEYLYTPATATDPAVYHYMQNGKDLVDGVVTVKGEKHYYRDSKRVNEGLVTLEGGKIVLIKAGNQVTTVGRTSYDGKYYYIDKNGNVINTGSTFTGLVETGAQADTTKTYYANTDGVLAQSELVKVADGKYNYYDDNCQMVVASSGADLYENVTGTDYYVNAAGEVAMNGLFKVGGKDYLFRDNGKMVKHTDEDVVDGKIKVDNIGYVIADDDTAKRDDILYNPVVKWTPSKFDSKWKKTDALPKFTYTVTVTSKNTGKEQTTDGTAVEAKVVKTTSENGVEKITLAVEANLAGYFVDAEGKTPATVDNTKNAKLEATYDFKNGSEEGKKEGSGEVPEDAEAESEPEKSDKANYNSYNLFFTDLVIPVDGLSEALASEGATQTGTWTGFYTVDESGNVVPKSGMSAKEAKNAVKAANSTITVTTTAGLFTYQLPVYYQKPTLQLSSKSATIKNGAETTVTTIVKQKKSNGDYEPIAVNADEGDGREVTYAAKKGNLKSWANGENDGEIAITADQAVNGNLVVKKTNWREDVKLSYKVTAKNTDVLVADKKIVKLNLNGKTEQGQLVRFTLNGADDLTGVTVTTPKKWSDAGVEMEGVAEDGTVSNEVTFKFTEGASHKKGNYSVVFKSPDKKSKATVKVSVTNTELNRAVTLKVKSKIDLTTGQKMVLIPTLNGIGGPIEEISLPGEHGTFGASDYNAATNQVVVSALNPASLNTKDNYDLTFNVQAAGEEFTAKVSFKVTAKKPTVKIANVKFPNTLGSAELEGATNVLSTYKYGGKTFSTEPVEVKFTNGAAVEGEEGWFTDSKTGAKVSYDAESGRILIKTASGAKAGTVKVSLKYAGQAKAINKTFKIQKAK